MAMELVETIEVGAGGAASIEFTSIPQDGVDLLLKLSTRGDSFYYISCGFNNDTTDANYAGIRLQGSGSAASSSANSNRYVALSSISSDTANTFGNIDVYIPNYTSSSDKSRTTNAVSENNATAAYQTLWATQWFNTDAISSIQLTLTGNDFLQYSTASLYKIY